MLSDAQIFLGLLFYTFVVMAFVARRSPRTPNPDPRIRVSVIRSCDVSVFTDIGVVAFARVYLGVKDNNSVCLNVTADYALTEDWAVLVTLGSINWCGRSFIQAPIIPFRVEMSDSRVDTSSKMELAASCVRIALDAHVRNIGLSKLKKLHEAHLSEQRKGQLKKLFDKGDNA